MTSPVHARQQRLAEAVDASHFALTLSRELYLRGLADFLTVLDDQRTLIVSLIALYKALGGGWEATEVIRQCVDCDLEGSRRQPRPASEVRPCELNVGGLRIVMTVALSAGCRPSTEAVAGSPPTVEVQPVAEKDVSIYGEWVGV